MSFLISSLLFGSEKGYLGVGVEFCDTALVVVLWGLCSFQYDQILHSSVGRAVELDIPWSRVRFPLEMTSSEL